MRVNLKEKKECRGCRKLSLVEGARRIPGKVTISVIRGYEPKSRHCTTQSIRKQALSSSMFGLFVFVRE
jgi:hypothetical protein